MTSVNMLEVKNNLSKLLRELELGNEDVFLIECNGKPVAQLVLYDSSAAQDRIGAARGQALVADDWDSNESDDEVAALFGVD